jgi:hypothetical protein
MPEYDKPRKPAQPATSPPQQALRNKPSDTVIPRRSQRASASPTSDSPLQIPGSHRRLQTPDYHPRPHQKTLRCEMKAKTPETPGSNHPTAPVATPT